MKDGDKTKEQLINELVEMRQRVARLEASETERKRAEEEQERLLVAEHEQRLLAETLAEVTLALTSQTSHSAVLDEILHQAQRIVPCSTANITLLEGDTLRVVRWQGYEAFGAEEMISGLVQSLDDLTSDAEVVHSRKPMVIPDTHQDPRWVVFDETAWIRSYLVIPICLRDRVLGLLRLDSETPGKFSAEDAERLQPLADAAAIALENTRLFTATRHQAEQLEMLREVGLELTAQLDLDTLLHSIVSRAMKLMGGDSGGLYLYRPEKDVLEWSMAVGPNLAPIGTTLRRGEGLSGRVWETGEPLIVDDYQAWEEGAAIYEGYSFGAVVGVPVRWGEEFLGVVNVLAEPPHTFSPADAKLLSLFATQAAIAIRNARLYEDTRRRGLEQETVSRIAYALNTPDVRDAFPVLVEGLQDLTGCDVVSLVAMDEAGEQFIMTVLESPFPPPVPPNLGGQGGVEGDVMPLSATAAAEDMEAGRPHLTADLSTETHFPLEQALYQAGLRSQVTLPLLVGGEVFGALNLGGSQTGLFREDQLPVLQQIADAVALALENSLLFQTEREQRDRAEALEEATAALTATLDSNQVLDRILEQVSRVVPNDATNIMLIEGNQMRIVRWRGYERFGAEEFVSTVVFHIPEVPNLQQMMESREPIVIPDTATYPGWVRIPVQAWLRSYAAAPIVVRGEVIGFLNVDSATPGFFTQDHAEALRTFADHAAAAIENARLYEAEQERRHIAETLRQAATVLSSTLELDEVLGLILQQLRQVIPYDSASVQRLEGEHLEILACQGFEEPDKVVGLIFPLNPKFPNYRVITTKVPLAIEDVVQDYPHFKDEANSYESGHIRSWLGVPLMVKDQAIGMIALDRVEVRPYTAEAAQLAMAFANQAAIAIENARLFEEEKRRATQLALINEVGEKAASILDLDRLMQEVTRSIQESFNYYNVALLLLDEERREAAMQAVAGGFEHMVPGEYRQSIDEGIIGFVARTGKSRLANDTSKDPYYVKGFLGEVLTKSELCVPIKLGDRVIGALDVQSIHLNDFNQADAVAMEAVADRVAIAIENARLYEASRRRSEELATLHAISLDITAPHDLPTLLQTIVERAARLLDATGGGMYLCDPERREVRCVVSYNTPRDYTGTVLKYGEGLAGTVAETGEPLIIDDYRAWPGRAAVYEEEQPFTTMLSAPMIWQGQVTGVIHVLEDVETRRFTQADLELLGLFASQAAIAIENARLFGETRRRALQLQTVEEVGRKVSSILDLDELFPYVVKAIQQSFGYYHVDIFLVEPATGYAVFKASSDPATEKVWKEQGLRFKIGEEGMIGWVAHSGEPLLANDVSQEPRYLPDELLPETKSELVIPLKVEEQVVGVLDVDSDELNAFDEDDLFVLQTLANQVAIAIENARLFERTEHLKAFNESVVQGIAEAILIEDPQGIFTFANPAAEELLGYTREELIGRHWTAIVPEDEIEKVRQELAKRPRGTLSRYETALLNKEGQVIPVIVSAQPLFEEDKFAGALSAFTDIRERVRAERETEERRRYLEGVLGAAPDAIVTLDAHHRIVEWNPGAERLFGYSREDAVGQNIDHLITSPDVFDEAVEFTQIVMAGKELPPVETVRYRKDGSPVDVIVAGSPILVGDELIGLVAVYTDITARKRMEETLRALALVDDLTGLYNRRGFLALAKQQLKAANRAKRRMALLFADFDGLKQINDALGHPEGDRALIEVANATRETFRESDIIARIGGDEFVVLAVETNGAPAEILAARLQENLKARNARKGRRYKLSLSMGLARYDPERPCSIDELLTRADRAMYERKRSSDLA